MLMKKDAKFFFQMHYTANGKQARDVSRMGLYFRKDVPQYQFRSAVMAKPSLEDPGEHQGAHGVGIAHVRSRRARLQPAAALALPRQGVELHRDLPGRHAGNAAVGAELRLQLADDVRAGGRRRRLPAGTKVTHSTTWDNSTQNKANPDPNREVPWGQQTWDEMLYGVVRFRYIDENSAPKETVSRTRE